MADLEKAQIQRDKEMLGFMEADGTVSDNEDIIGRLGLYDAPCRRRVGIGRRKTPEDSRGDEDASRGDAPARRRPDR